MIRHAAYWPHLTSSLQWPTLVSLRRLPPETDWLLGGGQEPLRQDKASTQRPEESCGVIEECP